MTQRGKERLLISGSALFLSIWEMGKVLESKNGEMTCLSFADFSFLNIKFLGSSLELVLGSWADPWFKSLTTKQFLHQLFGILFQASKAFLQASGVGLLPTDFSHIAGKPATDKNNPNVDALSKKDLDHSGSIDTWLLEMVEVSGEFMLAMLKK